jgi:lipid-A-disaccharide synthase
MQFVCPSVWAWRAERLDTIRQSVDHVLCLFPFEPPLLQRNGISASYVGHPLARSIPLSPDNALARKSLGVSPHQKLIALLPGSRTSEIEHMTPLFFAAARLLEQQYPGIGFVLPVAPGQMQLVKSLQFRFAPPQNLILLSGQSHTALAAADAAMVASGTATLEAALFKCPMVIAYHMPWLSWQIIRRKRLQAWVGLPNILCQDFIVPELLQEQATPSALAKETSIWLETPNLVDKVKMRFTDLHKQLTQDTSGLVTDAVNKIMVSHA